MKTVFLGRATNDLTYYANSYPVENEKIFAEEFLVQPGGPALNAAITFSLLGGEATIISKFGNSFTAKMILDEARNDNLAIIDLACNNEYSMPSSVILVNKSNGSRTIINSPKDSEINLNKQLPENLHPRLLLIDGYELVGLYDKLRQWKEEGCIIILDGGSWKNDMPEYLGIVDIAVCSDRFRIPGRDLNESIFVLHNYGIAEVAFTRGEDPVIVSSGGDLEEIEIDRVNAVDTLGAGDVFHGSFCFHIAEGKKFKEALKYAAADASNACRFVGTHTWLKIKQFDKN